MGLENKILIWLLRLRLKNLQGVVRYGEKYLKLKYNTVKLKKNSTEYLSDKKYRKIFHSKKFAEREIKKLNKEIKKLELKGGKRK